MVVESNSVLGEYEGSLGRGSVRSKISRSWLEMAKDSSMLASAYASASGSRAMRLLSKLSWTLASAAALAEREQ
jgi:hypothetical protein